jgi:hypothetical protein
MVDDLAVLERLYMGRFIGVFAALLIRLCRSASWEKKRLRRLYVQLPVIYSNDDWVG